jgi:hypothetical protein
MRWLGFVIAGAFALLICISLGDAATCSNVNFTMFRFGGMSNTHLGLWNYTVYTNSVCFDEFFNVSSWDAFVGVIGGDYRDSTPDDANVILRLYREGNSHANAPNETSYPIKVAYGDLSCAVVEGPTSCLDAVGDGGDYRGRTIAILSKYKNAHYNFTYDPKSYRIKICCYSTNFPTIVPPGGYCNYNNVTETENDEECDGGDLGGAECKDGPDGTNKPDGVPRCIDCKLFYGDCRSRPSSLLCEDHGYQDTSTPRIHKINISGILKTPRCAEYNQIQLSDVPGGHSLLDYKKGMCEDCSVDKGEYAGSLTYDGRCFWNVSSNTCYLGYKTLDNRLCTVGEVAGSDSGCLPGQVKKTINITDSCKTECAPPGGCKVEVDCPESVQFPFFDYKNVIASLLIIGVVYFIFQLKRK